VSPLRPRGITPTVGSHALLLQLTTNLLHNAIVHNLPARGSVHVHTAIGREGVELTVENTGERLIPQLVSTLTEPFQRGSDRIRSDHAGVGLGLAIARSIAEAHDGILTLTGRDAGGLRVTVQLPADVPAPAGLEAPSVGGAVRLSSSGDPDAAPRRWSGQPARPQSGR
jgi:two-component system sensor histidine kinase VanS